MKNPLWKRLPKELAADLGKYLVIFLFMILSIGFVSAVIATPQLHPDKFISIILSIQYNP